MPIILNIIENSRKGAAADSAYGYKDSINKYYVSELSNNNKLMLNGTYEVIANGVLNGNFGVTENAEDRTIPIDGTKPSSGKLRYSNNVLNAGCVVIGDYKVTFGTDGKVDGTVKGDCSTYEFPDDDSLPTMAEMCPGCVFTINKIDQGFMTGEVVSTGTTTDYSSFNRRTFVGLVLDGDNKVTRHFACGIYQKPATNEDIPFCVEGTSDSLIHSRNVSILNKIFGQGNYNDQNETWDWSDNDSNWYLVEAYPYDNHSSYSVNLDYSGDEGFVSCDGYGSSIYTS